MSINRRQLLTGALAGAGCVSLSPAMSTVQAAIESRARGGADHPLRFVFCIKSNGLWAELLQPRGLEEYLPYKLDYDEKGRLVGGNHGQIRKEATRAADFQMEHDVELNDLMAPLQPFQDRITILQGIDGGFPVYHKAGYQTLGAFAAKKRDTDEVGGVTVDSLLARAFPAPVPHVCLGHDPRSPSGVAYVPTSAEGRDKPIPFFTKPRRAYKDLFGVVDDGAARKSYDVQTDILDFFVDDARRLQTRIAGPERGQLDRYLNAFESLRRRREEVEAISDQLRQYAPPPPEEIDAGETMEIGRGNAEIAIGALLSGLTNVVTLRFDLLGSTSYKGIGGLHGGVGHGQVKNILDARRKICSFQFEQIARIAAALRSVPEGDGTMFDNTVFIYTSDNGETHHSSGVNYPIMILGDLGGRLARRRYFSPGNDKQPDRSRPGYTRLGDVWATLLAAAGQPYREFGRPRNGVPHRPLEALLT